MGVGCTCCVTYAQSPQSNSGLLAMLGDTLPLPLALVLPVVWVTQVPVEININSPEVKSGSALEWVEGSFVRTGSQYTGLSGLSGAGDDPGPLEVIMDPSVCWAAAHCDAEGAPGLAGLRFTHCAPETQGPPSLHSGRAWGPDLLHRPSARDQPRCCPLEEISLRLKAGCPI